MTKHCRQSSTIRKIFTNTGRPIEILTLTLGTRIEFLIQEHRQTTVEIIAKEVSESYYSSVKPTRRQLLIARKR